MKSTLEQIRQEITTKASQEQAAEQNAKKHEQETRHKLEDALARKAAALDAGDLEAYKAAGMEAESMRLEVEFIEQSNEKGRKPAASTEDDKRIRTALIAEGIRIRNDTLVKLKQAFTATVNVSAEALRQLSDLDKLYSDWESSVMHNKSGYRICSDSDRLMLSQFEKSINAQLERFKIIQG